MIDISEMSSVNMDISENFRPEDLSKTDFFDFVTAPDICAGMGVREHDIQPSQSIVSINSNNVVNSQTLHGYDQFWNNPKSDETRFESEIFEDIDRYCWQQHQDQQLQLLVEANANISAENRRLNETGNILNDNNRGKTNNSVTDNESSIGRNTSIYNPLNCQLPDGNLTSNNLNIDLNASDGHVYTLTVLNGNESWLKSPNAIIADAHLTPNLDLDSLLETFPPYIKPEFECEESEFSNSEIVSTSIVNCKSTSSTKNALVIPSGNSVGNNRNEPITKSDTDESSNKIQTISETIIAQFQNENTSWNDSKSIIQENSAESLLRSALQGKGYSKGLHLHNNISLMPLNSTKDEDLKRVLFSEEALQYSNPGLSNTIFDEHVSQSTISTSTNLSRLGNDQTNHRHQHNHSSSSTVVDDMFLSLDSTFSESFEKIKSIAEAQPFVATNNYSSDMIMEVATSNTVSHVNLPQLSCNGIETELDDVNTIRILQSQISNDSSQSPSINISTSEKINTNIRSTKSQIKKFKRTNSSSQCSDHQFAINDLSNGSSVNNLNKNINKSSINSNFESINYKNKNVKNNNKNNKNNKIINNNFSNNIYNNNNNNNNNNDTNNNNNNSNNNNNINNNNNNSNINDSNMSNSNYSHTNDNDKTDSNIFKVNDIVGVKNCNNSKNICNNDNKNNNNDSNNNNSSNNNNNDNLNTNINNNNNSNDNKVNLICSMNQSNSNLSNRSSPIPCNGQRKERSLHYCTICSKGFKDKYSVNVHIRTHTGEKPFACTLCGKSFRQKAHLAKHYQTHLAQKNSGGVVKPTKPNINRLTHSQPLNINNFNSNNINVPTTISTPGSQLKSTQLSSITPSSTASSNSISLSNTTSPNPILNSGDVNINSVSLPIVPVVTGILANR